MYICEECGDIFAAEDIKRTSCYAECGNGAVEVPYLEGMACPRCGSEDISEAAKCAKCGEYYAKDEYRELCDDCIEEVRKNGAIIKKILRTIELDLCIDMAKGNKAVMKALEEEVCA